MPPTQPPARSSPFQAFAKHFHARRDAVIISWLQTVRASPDLVAAGRTPVPQLIDHLPELFDDLLATLAGIPGADTAPGEDHAHAHGTRRWEQQFQLDELLRELVFVRRLFLHEFDTFHAGRQPPLAPADEARAREKITRFFDESGIQSAVAFRAREERRAVEERRALETRLEAARAMVEQVQTMDSARLRLLRVIAHELRNLLNAAILTADSLPGEEDAEWRADLHRMLSRNQTQMAALVSQLLEVAPLFSGREPPRLAPLDVLSFAAAQTPALARAAAAKDLAFDCDVDPTLRLVKTDELKLSRILTTLVDNAVKFTDAGRVHVELAGSGDARWELRVTDTGRGIPPDQRKRVWEEFYRVPGTEDQSGTGLGLTIVRQLVDQLSGDASVEEGPGGRGTTVRLSLPR